MAAFDRDVIIVGAGPTGLALAAELKRLGTNALLLDKLPEGQNTSRATVVHARTLEVLEPLDVSQRLIDRGLPMHKGRMFQRDKQLAEVRFDGLDTKYSFALICTQDQTETVLAARLQELGGAVTRPVEVTGILQDEEGVTVHYAQDGAARTERARWVVGCDGLHSVVRQQTGIAFTGGNYDESFVLADIRMDWPMGRETLDIFLSDEGLLLVVALTDDRFRVIATVREEPAPHPSAEDVQKILDARGPEARKAAVHEVVWSSRFRIQHRVASQLRKEHALICGDAAHVHSPAGGQGMNTGIQDAVSLAQVLHAVLAGGDEKALAEWQDKRLKIAREVVRTTDLMTRVVASDSAAAHLLRDTVLRIVGHVPFLQHKAAEQLSEIRNR